MGADSAASKGKSRGSRLKSWRIEVNPLAEKQYLKLGGKTRQRIQNALKGLENAVYGTSR